MDPDRYHELREALLDNEKWHMRIKRQQRSRDGTHWIYVKNRYGDGIAWGGPWTSEYRDEVYEYILQLFGKKSNIGPPINQEKDFWAELESASKNGHEPDFFAELDELDFFAELDQAAEFTKKAKEKVKDFWAELDDIVPF
jgi:hypothetical protein